MGQIIRQATVSRAVRALRATGHEVEEVVITREGHVRLRPRMSSQCMATSDVSDEIKRHFDAQNF